MSVSIQKVEGVESVTVSLKEGVARITLKPGNSVGLGQFREIVKRNGFTPRQATVKAEADVIGPGDRPQLKIRGVDETYQVADTAGSKGVADVMKHAGTAVHVEGVIAAPNDTQTLLIQIASVRASDRK